MNEVKRSKIDREKVIIGVILVLILAFIIVKCFGLNKKEENSNKLININSLSKEFVDDYLNEISSLTEEEKENTIILTSLNEIKDYNASKIIEGPNHQYYLVYDDEKTKNNDMSKMVNDSDIIDFEENNVVYLEDVDYNSWGISATKMDYAIDTANQKDLDEVVVAVIDTGVDIDLFNKYYSGKLKGYYNVLNNSNEDMKDVQGHGTHVAGTIAEATPKNVKVYSIKVTNSSKGSMYNTDITAAINYVVSNNLADVINMSFGSERHNSSIDLALDGAYEKNIINVAAAGNNGNSNNFYPAGFSNTIGISSVDSDMKLSWFSNYGKNIEFAAPGTNIKSIMGKDAALSSNDGDDDHETISGTSMATPHASAAVAILKSYNKNLTLDNVRELLKKATNKTKEDPVWDEQFGYGVINFENVEFCDGGCCDAFGVYKEENCTPDSIKSIEIEKVNFTKYNYGSLNNILPIDVKIIYNNSTSETKKLWQLSDFDINYDPFSSTEQNLTLTYLNKSVSFKLTNPASWELGWEYAVLDEDKKTIELTKYKDNYEKTTCRDNLTCFDSLYIPETLDGYTVVSLMNGSKQYKESNHIFDWFGDMLNDMKVYLNKSLENIGNYVFGFTNEVEIYAHPLNKGMIIGINPFNEYAALHDFKVSKLNEKSFLNSNIEEVTFTKELIDIPDNAFENIVTLKSITFEDKNNIASVGNNAFKGAINLENFDFSNVETIGDNAFYRTSIKEVNAPKLTSLGASAFYNSSIETFSSNITEIKESTFEYCSTLSEVNIPNVESIGKTAFLGINLSNFHVNKTLTSINDDSFEWVEFVDLTVDKDNPVYEEIDHSIVEKSTKKMLYGSANTLIDNPMISSEIKEIGSWAFLGNRLIKEVIIPEDLTIGSFSFMNCYNLEKVILYNKNINKSIINMAFRTDESDNIEIKYRTYYAYKDSDTFTNLKEKDFYGTVWSIDPTEITYSEYKTSYKFGEIPNVKATLTYPEREEDGKDIYVNVYPTKIKINGQDRDKFKIGDTSFTAYFDTDTGYTFTKEFNVSVDKNNPEYEIPSNLVGMYGKKLSNVILPTGFSWMDENIELNTLGQKVYNAKYTPNDLEQYNIIENIPLTVTIKEYIVPNIVIKDKEFNNSTNLDLSTISITNLDKSYFTITSANLLDKNAGSNKAKVSIKLTEAGKNKYILSEDNYNLDNKEYEVNVNVTKIKLKKPILNNPNYYYSGTIINPIIENFDENYMNISGNKEKDVGEHTITISLKSNNYVWEDLTSGDILLKYKILLNESDVYSTSDNRVIYDGKAHTINLNLVDKSYSIKSSLDNYKYKNDGLISFTNPGMYIINVKLSKENFEDIYFSNFLYIYGIKDFGTKVTSYNNILVLRNNNFNELISNINVYADSSKFVHLNKDNVVVSNNLKINTNDKIRITINNSTDFEYILSYLGDVNSDGEINSGDYVKIRKHIMGTENITLDVIKKAADVNSDGEINSSDYVKIRKYIMNGGVL